MIAAIIGGGVIGGGWAARFLLMGWDVRVFDPDPEAERKIVEVIDNARRSMPGLYDAALPVEGALRFCETLSDTVAGADWIQESVPERLELKRKVYQQVQAHCLPDAVLASSTSGFKPSNLQSCATRPDQIVVAHPFNPVYLLPLVELVTVGANSDIAVRAKAHLKAVGMFPLVLEAEIDAHVADRLLEAVWREALWLVKDGIATTEEIDEAIRMGFGLRWAQMGLFETYRIAGGEAGMRHFLAQFGPALKWPWTKLMDVPDLDDALIDRIAAQSDAQSGHLSIRALERQRDENLVAILRGLRRRNAGAGGWLAQHEATLAGAPSLGDVTRPILTARRAIPLDWTDYNGHMNEARYLEVFAAATDRFMEMIGCDAAYIAAGHSYFTAETHIRHLGECHAGDVVEVRTTCLSGDGKKMHLFHKLIRDGECVATGEHMLLHVSLETRKSCPPLSPVTETLEDVAKAHAALDRPDGAGRFVGQGR